MKKSRLMNKGIHNHIFILVCNTKLKFSVSVPFKIINSFTTQVTKCPGEAERGHWGQGLLLPSPGSPKWPFS